MPDGSKFPSAFGAHPMDVNLIDLIAGFGCFFACFAIALG